MRRADLHQESQLEHPCHFFEVCHKVVKGEGMGQSSALRYMGKLDKAGRVVIPAEIRAKAHLQPGSTVTITVGRSGRIVLEPVLGIVGEAQKYFLRLGPLDEVWSDELLAERRVAARREIED